MSVEGKVTCSLSSHRVSIVLNTWDASSASRAPCKYAVGAKQQRNAPSPTGCSSVNQIDQVTWEDTEKANTRLKDMLRNTTARSHLLRRRRTAPMKKRV